MVQKYFDILTKNDREVLTEIEFFVLSNDISEIEAKVSNRFKNTRFERGKCPKQMCSKIAREAVSYLEKQPTIGVSATPNIVQKGSERESLLHYFHSFSNTLNLVLTSNKVSSSYKCQLIGQYTSFASDRIIFDEMSDTPHPDIFKEGRHELIRLNKFHTENRRIVSTSIPLKMFHNDSITIINKIINDQFLSFDFKILTIAIAVKDKVITESKSIKMINAIPSINRHAIEDPILIQKIGEDDFSASLPSRILKSYLHIITSDKTLKELDFQEKEEVVFPILSKEILHLVLTYTFIYQRSHGEDQRYNSPKKIKSLLNSIFQS